MLRVRAVSHAALFVLQAAFADAKYAGWTASTQECTPAVKLPPGGRCLADDQCEFGECDPTYNFCRARCCTASGGNTCSSMSCWPSPMTRRTTHCGAAGVSWSMFPCRLGQPDIGGAKCLANSPLSMSAAPPGLCSSFKSIISANPTKSDTELDSMFSPVSMDLSDPRCECTSDVKDLWAAKGFVGHWTSSYTFVSACDGGSLNVKSSKVVLSMVVHNILYANLTSNPALVRAVKSSIKATVVAAVGNGVMQPNVTVEIADVVKLDSDGVLFAKVAATIALEADVKPSIVQERLSAIDTLAKNLTDGLRRVPGIGAISSGKIEVSNAVAVVGTAVTALYSLLAVPSSSEPVQTATTTFLSPQVAVTNRGSRAGCGKWFGFVGALATVAAILH